MAGPQLRNAGTIGGNVCLDTRCTYYNQTAISGARRSGFCLKKDGDVCHVTRTGKKCVAAHSADTPAGPDDAGRHRRSSRVRTVPVRFRIADFFVADGIVNTRRADDEILTEVRIPLASATRRQAYVKLRQRKSIDFPLLTVAIAAEMWPTTTRSSRSSGVVTGLGSRPRVAVEVERRRLRGGLLDDALIDELAERAHRQCHPLENIIVDPEWRRAMVPVFVRRALEQVAASLTPAVMDRRRRRPVSS